MPVNSDAIFKSFSDTKIVVFLFKFQYNLFPAKNVNDYVKYCFHQNKWQTYIRASRITIPMPFSGIIQGMCWTNERRCHTVTPSLTSLVQTQNDPCSLLYCISHKTCWLFCCALFCCGYIIGIGGCIYPCYLGLSYNCPVPVKQPRASIN